MGAVRHLTFEQAVAALRRGKAVEQLLESAPREGRPTVRWLTVNPGRDECSVWAHHVYDEGELGIVDVTEFSPVDAEEYVGEGVIAGRHADPEAALEAARALGAQDGRWVNSLMVGDEYADRRAAG